jgi:hypothetical protein
MKQIGSYQILEIFKVAELGVVVVGYIQTSERISLGDFIELEVEGTLLQRKIIGIDFGTPIYSAQLKTGLLIKPANQAERKLLEKKYYQYIAKIYRGLGLFST